MPFLSPRFGVTTDVATAMAKGIKKGMVPENRLPTSETAASKKVQTAEQLHREKVPSFDVPSKRGLLARLRSLIFRR